MKKYEYKPRKIKRVKIQKKQNEKRNNYKSYMG